MSRARITATERGEKNKDMNICFANIEGDFRMLIKAID
jgi:hypothetical protein